MSLTRSLHYVHTAAARAACQPPLSDVEKLIFAPRREDLLAAMLRGGCGADDARTQEVARSRAFATNVRDACYSLVAIATRASDHFYASVTWQQLLTTMYSHTDELHCVHLKQLLDRLAPAHIVNCPPRLFREHLGTVVHALTTQSLHRLSAAW
jgi:hypothetical protein